MPTTPHKSATKISVEPLLRPQEAVDFLSQYEETSQFLINNLRDYGPTLGEFAYSGNFRVLKKNGKVVGIFSLAKCGNLYVQTDGSECTAAVLESCAAEDHPVQGFLGSWSILSPIYEEFCRRHPEFKTSFASKEVLYRLTLTADNEDLGFNPEVRLLTEDDFGQWFPLRNDYVIELHLSNEMPSDQVKTKFKSSTARKTWWGYFHDGELCSMAGLNSNSERIGQVGGVFTPVAKRQLGYSKATMLHMLKDCRDLHGHQKSILFTGDRDTAAQKLYESIGYERFGHFALILK